MKENSRVKYIGNPKELNKYVGGLVNNWIRKCKEFNSGIQHKPKNPGSRKGYGDEQVKEMRKLLKTISDKETRVMIESAIEERLKVITPKIEVNVSNLPEHLRHLV